METVKVRKNFNNQCNFEFENVTFPPDVSNEYAKPCLSKNNQATSNQPLNYFECVLPY